MNLNFAQRQGSAMRLAADVTEDFNLDLCPSFNLHRNFSSP